MTAVLLLSGDVAIFVFSLWLAMLVRSGGLPSVAQFYNELVPFCVLFALWVLIFYIAGLYSKSTVLFKSRMLGAIFNTQIINIVLAALFFFVIPYFGITPKTVLAIYLVISLSLIFLWRLLIFPRLTSPAVRERAAVIGVGLEVDELVQEINSNPRYPLYIDHTQDPALLTTAGFPQFIEKLTQRGTVLLIVDLEHTALREVQPLVYDLVFINRLMRFVDLNLLYEEVFDRVPLLLLNYEWFLSNLTRPASGFYLTIKRLVDIAGAMAMGAVTVVATPFVWIAMLIEDRGPLFITQERMGMHGSLIRTYKFRSMSFNDSASASWIHENGSRVEPNRITRVGAFLRTTSLDEFPQFVNVRSGQVSLGGPRNDIAGLGTRLMQAIPYYNVRYAVRPGITGWAQINQHYEPGNISPQSIAETKMRLAYDFYYIKNRSVALEVIIMLKTLKRMFFRIGSL